MWRRAAGAGRRRCGGRSLHFAELFAPRLAMELPCPLSHHGSRSPGGCGSASSPPRRAGGGREGEDASSRPAEGAASGERARLRRSAAISFSDLIKVSRRFRPCSSFSRPGPGAAAAGLLRAAVPFPSPPSLPALPSHRAALPPRLIGCPARPFLLFLLPLLPAPVPFSRRPGPGAPAPSGCERVPAPCRAVPWPAGPWPPAPSGSRRRST